MNNVKRVTLLCLLLISFMGVYSQIDTPQTIIDTIPLQGAIDSADIAAIPPAEVDVVVPVAPPGASFNSVLRGVLGIFSLLLIAFLFSRKKKNIDWKVVGIGLGVQILLAIGILYVPFVQSFFEVLAGFFVKVTDFTKAGADFLFGNLLDTSAIGYIFVFQVLPTIVFFSAFTSLLYYLNVIQVVVVGIAWLLKKAFRLSGAEGLTVAGNIFLGQTEAPLLVKRYLPNMNRSEIFLDRKSVV